MTLSDKPASRLILVPPTWDRIEHVCNHMRDADRTELAAMRGPFEPVQVARDFFMLIGSSIVAHVAVSDRDGEPIALLFITRTGISTLAMVSMIATDRIGEIGVPLTRHVLKKIRPMLIAAGFRRMEVRTHEGHTVSRRWLKAIGAVEEAPVPDFGVNGETFIQMAWRISDVHGRRSTKLNTNTGPYSEP